jgi:hypothetical protein
MNSTLLSELVLYDSQTSVGCFSIPLHSVLHYTVAQSLGKLAIQCNIWCDVIAVHIAHLQLKSRMPVSLDVSIAAPLRPTISRTQLPVFRFHMRTCTNPDMYTYTPYKQQHISCILTVSVCLYCM